MYTTTRAIANGGRIPIALRLLAVREGCGPHLGSDPYWRVGVVWVLASIPGRELRPAAQCLFFAWPSRRNHQGGHPHHLRPPLAFRCQIGLLCLLYKRKQLSKMGRPPHPKCPNGNTPLPFTSPNEKLVCKSFTLGKFISTCRANWLKVLRSRDTTCNSNVPVPLM